MLTGSQNRRNALLTNCPNYVEKVHWIGLEQKKDNNSGIRQAVSEREEQNRDMDTVLRKDALPGADILSEAINQMREKRTAKNENAILIIFAHTLNIASIEDPGDAM